MSGGETRLSHVDEAGGVRMVDVGGKPFSRRRAVAEAIVGMSPQTAAILRSLPKGDALATAQLAGIMAAKRTAELIPLCHPLPLSAIDVELELAADHVTIVASVETTAQTGVEMEALTAASVAALTVYDMAKAVDKGMVVRSVRLLEKTRHATGPEGPAVPGQPAEPARHATGPEGPAVPGQPAEPASPAG